MNTKQLLAKLERAWLDFEDAYAGLTPDELLTPGVTGQWSVRDIIAHVTWWEEESLAHMPGIREGKRPPKYSAMYGGIDAFNALMTDKRRGLSLAEVMLQHDEVHARLLAFVRAQPAALWETDTRVRRRLRLDTYGHYPVHTKAIRGWRARKRV